MNNKKIIGDWAQSPIIILLFKLNLMNLDKIYYNN